MSPSQDKIIYTYTDEAPMLATYSLLPIIQCFAKACGVAVETRDISVAGRVLAQFPDVLTEEQKALCGGGADYLSELGDLCKTPEANIIKLPNISASIPQLETCIAELQNQGFAVPNYPAGDPQTDEERDIKAKYAKVLGSAVNPVLREGNSDRRVAKAVKDYAKTYPKKLGKWSKDCKSHVSAMNDGDFYGSEKSVTNVDTVITCRIELVDGEEVKILKEEVKLQKGEVADCSRMSAKALRTFYGEQIAEAKSQGVLFSLHLKATMMKISDPILFGHCVEVYYKDVFEKFNTLFHQLGVKASNGIGDVYAKIAGHSQEAEVKAAIEAVYASETTPALAMVDSDRGVTNLHCPSDVIIDASMPCVVRDSGGMWCPDSVPGARDSCLKDVKCVIPDRSYAGMYKASLDFCRENGEFDVTTMGNVANVGLMAIKAEEYGSHDKTFEVPDLKNNNNSATIRVVNNLTGDVVMEQGELEKGDIFRMCQTKDVAIRDWVKLAVSRSRLSGSPVVFWLDPQRAHDREMIKKVEVYLADHDTKNLDVKIMDPVAAVKHAMQRAKEGKDTISATGNVLRDYLTDLFPILELGTSAKMLSIVPLLAGGCMFETGAGGSAPKHVQQFIKEDHLRWDSLGEFLALAESLDMVGRKGSRTAKILAEGLHKANAQFLVNKECQVSRKVMELDNRGSHFYLATYWAHALASQNEDKKLQEIFKNFYKEMCEKKEEIVNFLNSNQGRPVDLGGYYKINETKTEAAMRPCKVWNELLEKWGKAAAEAAPSGNEVIIEGSNKAKDLKCNLGCITGGKTI